jgi:hypothetical protein
MESDEKIPKTSITKIGGNIVYEFLKAPNNVKIFITLRYASLIIL